MPKKNCQDWMKEELINKVKKCYQKYYTGFATSLFIILILIIICLFRQNQIYLRNNKLLLQTAFLGIITFSIPFLWNAYKELIEIKKHIAGTSIKDILRKENYQKSLKYFEIYVQYPTGIFIFSGLLLIPLSHYAIGIGIVVVSFFYFLLLPQIFQKIEVLRSTTIKDLLSEKEAESEDLQKAFLELWSKSDQDIKKEFLLDFIDLFIFMSKKIDTLISKEEPTIVFNYLKDFSDFVNNRSIIYLVLYKEVFPKILEWHSLLWEKEIIYSDDDTNREKWYKYRTVVTTLSSLIKTIEERSFKEKQAYLFFYHFNKHVEQNIAKILKNKKEQEKFYVKSLFDTFYEVFFKEIDNSPEKYAIFDYIPTEWKVSKNNLDDRENIMTRITLIQFYDWAQMKIWPPDTKTILIVDEMIICLFPGIDPMTFAPILIFVLSPQVTENQVKFIIERPWNFGKIHRPMPSRFFPSGIEREAYMKIISDDYEQKKKQETEKTFELICLLFKNEFSKDKLKDYVIQTKSLTYPENPLNERKRIRLLNIFEGILLFLEKPK